MRIGRGIWFMETGKVMRVRCYAEQVQDQWQAFCVDLNLAVQGSSLSEVQSKLNDMVQSYVCLANEQESAADQRAMLYRPAPLSIILRYWLVFLNNRVRRLLHYHRSRFYSVSWHSGAGGYC